MDGPKLQTKMSTWTPLNHQLMNDKASSMQMGWIHGITELLSLQRASGDDLGKSLKAEWARGFAQDLFQLGLEYLQILKQILFHLTNSQVSEKKKTTYGFGCVGHE